VSIGASSRVGRGIDGTAYGLVVVVLPRSPRPIRARPAHAGLGIMAAMTHRVTLIPGDGIGPELAEASRRVLDASGVTFLTCTEQQR